MRAADSAGLENGDDAAGVDLTGMAAAKAATALRLLRGLRLHVRLRHEGRGMPR